MTEDPFTMWATLCDEDGIVRSGAVHHGEGGRERWVIASALRDSQEDRLLSADEAAEMLQVSAWQVRRWAVERHIPAIKLGRFWRFRRSSLQAWLAEQERGAR